MAKDGDGRYPIVLGPDHGHPLGRLVLVRGGEGSELAYRVDGRGRLRLEERVAAGRRTVTALAEFVRTTPGRALPTRVTTSSWELATGALIQSEEVSVTHGRLAHAWLPERRLAAIADARGRRTALLELSRHQLL